MKRVAFCTLGCKVNQYETDAMEELFQSSGYEVVNFSDVADVYVINTCTVTNMADRKSRQMLHRAKKKNPNSIIVAVGCYVQAAKEQLEKDEAIDLIVGNNKKSEIVSLVEAKLADIHAVAEAVIDINHTHEYEALSISKVSEHTRAYIKIQDGCNQFCSYCIIPFARGRVRSRDAEDIILEVKRLVANGYKEIVLTGIHISSYGLDFIGEEYNNQAKDEHLINLIEQLAEIEGLCRIRLGSLEPRIVTEEFTNRLSAVDKICPHFHLSLQSGCDATLKRMNRKYTADEYAHCCDILRKYFEEPAITTDVIVGFPGETADEFQQTMAFAEKIRFAQMHIFKYSKRQGTRAAVMENQVDENIKNIRSDQLLEIDARLTKEFQEKWAGKTSEVLIEEKVEIGGQSYLTGHTKEYIRVAMKYEPGLVNTVVNTKILLTNLEDFVICERID